MHRRSHPVPGAFIVALLLAALCLQPAGIVIARRRSRSLLPRAA
jgi:hypothetical protein